MTEKKLTITTLKRLPLYYNIAIRALARGENYISSAFIAEKLETSKGRITVTGFMDTNPEAIKQMILPRCAVVAEHQETLALQKRYENDREKIIGILGQNDFLEAIIGSLTSE